MGGTEVIRVSKQVSAGGDRVTDERGNPVPSQRLTTGELAVTVRDVPPFGAARFQITHGEAHFERTPVTVRDGVLDNGLVRIRIDGKTGNIVELFAKGHPGNLVDTSGGSGLNEFLLLERQRPQSAAAERGGVDHCRRERPFSDRFAR